jgi:hypothetical protein
MKSTLTPKVFLNFFTALLLLLSAGNAFAQRVEVDKKTGLVKVDDKEVFYLQPKSVSIMNNDFSLQNLDHKELAYLKYTPVERYRNGSTSTEDQYLMVFTETGNQCMLTGFGLLMGTIKPMAKQIVAANLVQNGSVSMNEERKFVNLHNGQFVSATPVVTAQKAIVISNNDGPKNIPPADISLKNSSIYNHSELVGVFKRVEEEGNTVVTIYNMTDALIARATHTNGNESADWNVAWDGRTATILYNSDAPLEKLFKYLVEKGVL